MRDALGGKHCPLVSRPDGRRSRTGVSLLEGSAERSQPERELGIAYQGQLRACTTRIDGRAAWKGVKEAQLGSLDT